MINKDLTLYPEALELKQLGFDEPCFTYYFGGGILSETPRESGDDIKYQGDYKFDNHQNSYLEEGDDCSAPTYSQAFRWFRDTHNCHHTIKFINEKYVGIAYSSVVNFSIDEFDTYEEAELACLKELIEIVKEGNK